MTAVQIPRVSARVGELAASVFVADRGYADFDEAYYRAGRMVIGREPLTPYAPEPGSNEPGHFVNLPIVAWLFAPLAVFPKTTAGDVLLVFNAGVSVAALLLLLQRIAAWGARAHWAATLALASSGPLMHALNLGQTTPLVLLVLLLGERALARGHDGAAGAWLATAALIKVPLVAFLPYFAYRRRWRLVASATALLAVVTAVSVALYAAEMHAAYLEAAFVRHAGLALPSHTCQSVAAVIARIATDASLWSWEPVRLSSWARVVHGASVLAIIAVSAWSLRRRQAASYSQATLELALVLAAALLVFPIYWTHYGVWLVPAAVAVAGPPRAASAVFWVVVAAMLLINFPTVPRPIIERFDHDLWFRALISHQAAGTLILFAVAVWRVVTFADDASG